MARIFFRDLAKNKYAALRKTQSHVQKFPEYANGT